MKKIFIPRYVHFYSVDDSYFAVLNAMTLDLIYCQKELIEFHENTAEVEDKVYEILLQRGMILTSYLDEKNRIEDSIEKYINVRENAKIKFLYLVPTVQCNLKCTYCHIQHGKENRKRIIMSEDTLRKGLEIFRLNGGFEAENAEIMYYGGEPFLEVEFLLDSLEIIRTYSKTIKITIFTNGTLITEKIAEELKKYNLYVIVSMDGSEKVHDLARVQQNGENSFQRAKAGYKNLQKAGIDVGISLVAGTHNVDTLEMEVQYLAEEFNPLDLGISTLHLFPDMRNPNEVDIKYLTEKLQLVQSTMRKKGLYIEHLFRKIRPFVEKKARLYDCPSCNSKLLITPWDTVGFCEAFMEDEKYFYDMEKFSMDSCKGRDDWRLRVPLTDEVCYSCPAVCICGGGCPYDAYCESGSVCDKDTRRCYQSREMIRWLCLDLFAILRKNKKILCQRIYEPSSEERQLLYGNVVLDDSIPLQNYSKSNEGTE